MPSISARSGSTPACPSTGCRVVELRQYTLHPDQRDALIELFDREFVESQEALGMQVLGQFRDLDDPDRFVWLRGFSDMKARQAGLAGFYGGPVWGAHRDAANATMIDSDDVLLLRPVSPNLNFRQPDRPRLPVGSSESPRSLVTATVYPLTEPAVPEVIELVSGRLEPLVAQAGGHRLAVMETEPARNTYPALPVREGEHVLVRFTRFDDALSHATHLRRLGDSPEWKQVQSELGSHLLTAPQELRLQPTARSLLQ